MEGKEFYVGMVALCPSTTFKYLNNCIHSDFICDTLCPYNKQSKYTNLYIFIFPTYKKLFCRYENYLKLILYTYKIYMLGRKTFYASKHVRNIHFMHTSRHFFNWQLLTRLDN